MSPKTEVYAWRVSPALKAGLEEVARRERRSVSQVLDEIVAEHLQAVGQDDGAEIDRQRRLHERAVRFAGRLSGSGTDRAERARHLVRERLRRRAR